MDLQSTNNKSKSKSSIRPKHKNKTKNRRIHRELVKSLLRPCKSDIEFCMQSLKNYFKNFHHKFRITVYNFLKWRICTGLTILSSILSLVKAYSEAIITPIDNEGSGYDNLLVCLPVNTNSCIPHVNSIRNGLIELNETLYPALKAFRGFYDYKMIARINPFWLTFEPPSDTCYFIMGVLYMIIFCFGVTGNGLVIYMFARCKALRTASYILVFNLAVSDIMIVIKCPMAAYNNFMRGPALGDWGCRMYGFIGGFSGTASIGMLTIISLDRYSVVVNPLSPLRCNHQSIYYYVLLAIVWFNALLFSMLPLCEVGLSTYVPEGYLTTCSFDYLDTSTHARVFMFLFFIFAWLIPLAIICYCYFHILKAVFTAKTIQSNRNKQQIEVRLALIVLLVIGLWFLAWTPYALVAMAGIFGQEAYLSPTKSMIPALFCKTASCLNPFLYTISHKRFRNELQRLFCKRPPIYQYSMTRSSYMTRSSRRTRNRVDLNNDVVAGLKGVGIEQSAYQMELDAYRKTLRAKMSIDSIVAGPSDFMDSGQQQKQQHNLSDAFKKHRKSIKSPDESSSSIFILDLNPANTICRSPPIQPLETDF